MKKRVLIVAGLMLLAAGRVWGEEFSLTQALELALARHPGLEAARQGVVAAEGVAGEAASRLQPRVTVGESLYYTDEPAGSMFISLNHEKLAVSNNADLYNQPPARNDFETKVEVTQPLYDSDLGYGRKRAEQAIKVSRLQAGFNAESVAFGVFRAYLEVQRATAALAWAEAREREAGEVLRLARERQEAGVGLKAETLRAEVQGAQVRQQSLSARNDVTLARQSLAVAMGSEATEVGISGPLGVEFFPPGLDGDAGRRDDLLALGAQEKGAELAYEQSQAAYLPKAGLKAGYSLHDRVPLGMENRSWTVQAALTWELFDGQSRAYAAARSLAEQLAARSRRLEQERRVGLGVREADLRAEEAGQQRLTAKLAVAQAEESYRLYLSRYEAGLSSLADLLAAQRELTQAGYAVVAAEIGELAAVGNRFYQRGQFLRAAGKEKEL